MNLLSSNEDLANAVWTKTRSTIAAGGTTPPSGPTSAAQFLCESSASGTHTAKQILSTNVYAGQRVTMRLAWWVKPGTRSWCNIGFDDGTDGGDCFFQLSGAGALGTFTPYSGATNNSSARIASLGSSWYQVELIQDVTWTGGSPLLEAFLLPSTGDTVYSFVGTDLAHSIEAVGAFLEILSPYYRS